MIVFVVVGAVGCLALGWWQWLRFESADGNGQNLGYAFQWPLFAAFLVYAYRRFVQLESGAAERPDTPAPDEPLREIPHDLLPPRPVAVDDEDDDSDAGTRREYNHYLAELAARDADRRTE
nr:transcriptional regulator [Rhodococcus sp. HNM0569]